MISERKYFEQFDGESVLDIPIITLRGKISNRAYNAAVRAIRQKWNDWDMVITVDYLVEWIQSDDAIHGRMVGVGTIKEIKGALKELHYI